MTPVNLNFIDFKSKNLHVEVNVLISIMCTANTFIQILEKSFRV